MTNTQLATEYAKIHCEDLLSQDYDNRRWAFLAGYAAAKAKEGWIRVDERLPNKLVDLLFTNTLVTNMRGELVKPQVIFGWYDGKCFRSYIDPRDEFHPTHWQPLPIVPKTDTHDR